MIAQKSIALAKEGNRVLILAPNHDACSEIIGMIKSQNNVDDSVTVVHMYGKRDETSLDNCAKKSCSQCKIFKRSIKKDFLKNIVHRGKTYDIKLLQSESQNVGACPYALGMALSKAGSGTVVITVLSYLTHKSNRKYLEAVMPNIVFIDEGDVLFDLLADVNAKSIFLMGSRTNKNYLNSSCPERCQDCKPHFADNVKSFIGPTPGIISDYSITSNNMIEAFVNLVGIAEDHIKEGKIKPDIFNLDNIRQNIKNIEDALKIKDDNPTAAQYIENLIKDKPILRFFPDVPNEDGPCGILLDIHVSVADQGRKLLYEIDELVEKNHSNRILTNLKVDEGQKLDEPSVRAFIKLVELFNAAGDKLLILLEKANSKTGNPCQISLKAVDAHNYIETVAFLKDRDTILLSGTFLHRKLVSACLLDKNISYQNHKVEFHKNAVILTHNPLMGKKFATPYRLHNLEEAHLKKIYEGLADLPAKILHFGVNTKNSNRLFKMLQDDLNFTELYRLENHCNKSCEIDDNNKKEKDIPEAANLLVIDKLRSSTSRGINRNLFNLCVVHGNGYHNWLNYYPLHLMFQQQGFHIPLAELIDYNRSRAVFQALLRAPRDEGRTVCLYIGDKLFSEFPEDLMPRVISTFELCRHTKGYKGGVAEQVRLIINFIRGFINEDLTFSNDQYKNPESELSTDELFLVKSWQSEAQNGNTSRFAAERLLHIKTILNREGKLQIKKHRIGKYNVWKDFVFYLVTKGYLIERKKWLEKA